MAVNKVAKTVILLGKCVPTVKTNAAKIAIKRMELDTRLTVYFTKFDHVYAHDPEQKCKTGDIVLIEELPQKLTKLITHKVNQVVYPYGDVTDPITGKKCVIGKYREEVEEIGKLYGETKEAFDYKKAPPRGWQGDKKDITNRPTYKHYHVFDKEDPYAV